MSRSFHFGELNQIKTASSKLAVVFTKLASSATADSSQGEIDHVCCTVNDLYVIIFAVSKKQTRYLQYHI